jgi:hypothetical protein
MKKIVIRAVLELMQSQSLVNVYVYVLRALFWLLFEITLHALTPALRFGESRLSVTRISSVDVGGGGVGRIDSSDTSGCRSGNSPSGAPRSELSAPTSGGGIASSSSSSWAISV